MQSCPHVADKGFRVCIQTANLMYLGLLVSNNQEDVGGFTTYIARGAEQHSNSRLVSF